MLMGLAAFDLLALLAKVVAEDINTSQVPLLHSLTLPNFSHQVGVWHRNFVEFICLSNMRRAPKSLIMTAGMAHR